LKNKNNLLETISLALVHAFSDFPDYSFLWRFDASLADYWDEWRNTTEAGLLDEIAVRLASAENIFQSKWLPQKALLSEILNYFITLMH
jgi:hypothetical protein